MWVIVVAVIGGLILLGILILSIPFNLVWHLEITEKTHYHLRWTWFFGLVGRDIRLARRGRREKTPEEQPSKKKARRRFGLGGVRNATQALRMLPDYLRIHGLPGRLLRLARGVWRRLNFKSLEADLVIGLDDPADTFYVFTVLESLNRALDYCQPYPIKLWTSFMGATLEFYTSGRLQVYPVRLIPPFLGFLFSMPVFRLIRQLISDRWKIRRLLSRKPRPSVA